MVGIRPDEPSINQPSGLAAASKAKSLPPPLSSLPNHPVARATASKHNAAAVAGGAAPGTTLAQATGVALIKQGVMGLARPLSPPVSQLPAEQVQKLTQQKLFQEKVQKLCDTVQKELGMNVPVPLRVVNGKFDPKDIGLVMKTVTDKIDDFIKNNPHAFIIKIVNATHEFIKFFSTELAACVPSVKTYHDDALEALKKAETRVSVTLLQAGLKVKSAIQQLEKEFYKKGELSPNYDNLRKELQTIVDALKTYGPDVITKSDIASPDDVKKMKEFQKLVQEMKPVRHEGALRDLTRLDASTGQFVLGVGDAELRLIKKTGLANPKVSSIKNISDISSVLKQAKNCLSDAHVKATLQFREILSRGDPTANDTAKLATFVNERAKQLKQYEEQFATSYSPSDLKTYEKEREEFSIGCAFLTVLSPQAPIPAVWSDAKLQQHQQTCKVVDSIVDQLEVQNLADKNGTGTIKERYNAARATFPELRQKFLALSTPEREIVATCLKNAYPHEAVDTFLYSFSKAFDPSHLALGAPTIDIPKEKAPGAEAPQLQTFLREVDFAPEELQTLGLKPEKAKKGIDDYVEILEQNKGFKGMPAKSEPFQEIKRCLTHIIAAINKEKNPVKMKAMKAELLTEILRASGKCGPRQYVTIIGQFQKQCHGVVPTFEDSIAKLTGEARDIAVLTIALRRSQEAAALFAKIPKNRHDPAREKALMNPKLTDEELRLYKMSTQNVHYYNALVEKLGQKLAIPGYETIVKMKDIWVATLLPRSVLPQAELLAHEKERFLALYTGKSIVDDLYREMRGQDLREGCMDWWKSHMPYKWDVEFIDNATKKSIPVFETVQAEVIKMRADRKTQAEIATYVSGPQVDALFGGESPLYIDPKWPPERVDLEIEAAKVGHFIQKEVQELYKVDVGGVPKDRQRITQSAIEKMLIEQEVLASPDDPYRLAELQKLKVAVKPVTLQEQQTYALHLGRVLAKAMQKEPADPLVAEMKPIFLAYLKTITETSSEELMKKIAASYPAERQSEMLKLLQKQEGETITACLTLACRIDPSNKFVAGLAQNEKLSEASAKAVGALIDARIKNTGEDGKPINPKIGTFSKYIALKPAAPRVAADAVHVNFGAIEQRQRELLQRLAPDAATRQKFMERVHETPKFEDITRALETTNPARAGYWILRFSRTQKQWEKCTNDPTAPKGMKREDITQAAQIAQLEADWAKGIIRAAPVAAVAPPPAANPQKVACEAEYTYQKTLRQKTPQQINAAIDALKARLQMLDETLNAANLTDVVKAKYKADLLTSAELDELKQALSARTPLITRQQAEALINSGQKQRVVRFSLNIQPNQWIVTQKKPDGTFDNAPFTDLKALITALRNEGPV